ncbi:hypothetical protein FBU30_001730 [Linnemannia zychae]|nr:hypothetical protein FBU30_001730 [Linnemannia zychae]
MFHTVGEYITVARRQIISLIWPKYRVMIVGTSNSGKTTLLYRLHLNQPVTTIPTHGFNIEKVLVQGIEFVLWEIGGSWFNRSQDWHCYLEESVGIICVIDSTDEEQFERAKSQLWSLYEDNNYALEDKILLVYANKQDCLTAMSVNEIKDRLELETRARGRRWHIQGCVAATGHGLVEDGVLGVIYVIDSSDEVQFDFAKQDLWRVYDSFDTLDEETVLLVFANKQDQCNAMSVREVMGRLEMETRAGGRRWRVQGSVATTGEGFMEGMMWLSAQLKYSSRK